MKNPNLYFFKKIVYFLCCFVLLAHKASAQTLGDADNPIVSDACHSFTFDASKSYDPDKEDVRVHWYFGDGHSSKETKIQHQYEKSGVYEVVLTVMDDQNAVEQASQWVKVRHPPIINDNIPATACVNQAISVSTEVQPNGLPVQWDFGDGTLLDGESVEKAYQAAGEYSLLMRVGDITEACLSAERQKIIKVFQAPYADAGPEQQWQCIENDADWFVKFRAFNEAGETLDSDSEVTWDFGDGQTARGTIVEHQYQKPGLYDVTLTVRRKDDGPCPVAYDFVRLRIDRPVKAQAGEDVTVCINQEVLFDGSQSQQTVPGTLVGGWEFGDGQHVDQLITKHRFEKAGVYQSQLSVSSLLNPACPDQKDVRQITVHQPPVLSWMEIPSACAGSDVVFDVNVRDRSADTIKFFWDFGDGTIVQGAKRMTHRYQSMGPFHVQVVADDGQGTMCSASTLSRKMMLNHPPIVKYQTEIMDQKQRIVRFDASSTVDPDLDDLKFIWDFGDGASLEGMTVSHTYKDSGTYNVSLTVDDQKASACSQQKQIFSLVINQPPVPVISVY